MLKLFFLVITFLIITMVIAMSTHATDKDKPDPKSFLHEDFFKEPIQKTVNQHHVDFFRMLLLDERGKKFLKMLLAEKIGLGTKKALQTIQFMEESINNIDQQARILYTKQQALFINQYNKGVSEQEKITSYRNIHLDRETIMEAETIIQSKLSAITENSVSKLGNVIGEDSALNLNNWMMDYVARSSLVEDVDPEEYLKEISE